MTVIPQHVHMHNSNDSIHEETQTEKGGCIMFTSTYYLIYSKVAVNASPGTKLRICVNRFLARLSVERNVETSSAGLNSATGHATQKPNQKEGAKDHACVQVTIIYNPSILRYVQIISSG